MEIMEGEMLMKSRAEKGENVEDRESQQTRVLLPEP